MVPEALAFDESFFQEHQDSEWSIPRPLVCQNSTEIALVWLQVKAKEDSDAKVATISKLEAETAKLAKEKQARTEELQGVIVSLENSKKAEMKRLEEQLSALSTAKVSSQFQFMYSKADCEATVARQATQIIRIIPVRCNSRGWCELGLGMNDLCGLADLCVILVKGIVIRTSIERHVCEKFLTTSVPIEVILPWT